MHKTDVLFEVSWEVCNKVGGINTVIATKAKSITQVIGANLIMIGPDVWKDGTIYHGFLEDEKLLSNWRKHLENEGITVRIGRWDIVGNPVVVLVDFAPFFSQKNEIFTYFWESYKLDSISGEWDYIEPTVFGYVAGKIIESYSKFFLTSEDRVIAQFHEWMTGSGILYLKDKAPHIATVFTTHATALGRSIAGNHLPLYENLSQYQPVQMAKRFNITSKYSLERISAEQADAFTTVSKITGNECKHLLRKEVDFVTPNGFEDSFVPNAENFNNERELARTRLTEVTQAVLGYSLKSDNPLFIINSGRYEFKNKGIDLMINALADLSKTYTGDREIVAFIMVPAHQIGLNNIVKERLQFNEYQGSPEYLTHQLYDESKDPVINLFKHNQLNNSATSKVKVIFSPVYLDGHDGIFEMSYYKLLIGFDLSVFPSYYEPWGYTPMESLAFHIPTVTTTLAGFGKWIQDKLEPNDFAAKVIERNDSNDAFVTKEIHNFISGFVKLKPQEVTKSRKKAHNLSELALWKNLVEDYFNAYEFAFEKADHRKQNLSENFFNQPGIKFQQIQAEEPKWNKVLVRPHLPDRLLPLFEISKNLWWTWNYQGAELFKSIDPQLWELVEFNPIAMIEALSISRLAELERNESFINRLNNVYADYLKYINLPVGDKSKQIAYFSMEFGLHDSVKIFSGGLGILAGDYIKEASDNNVPMVAIGLLYRFGYFKQKITLVGDQIAEFKPQKFTHLPLEAVRDENEEWIVIGISLPRRVLYAKVWQLRVGRVKLYLLDTDINENNESDRKVTHQLYGGGHENRFIQELLLGVGGIRLLEAIKEKPSMFHCNEGHAAFIGVERLRQLINYEKLSFSEATEVVRSSTLFTTHTPVPAGHDTFEEDLLRAYIPHYPSRLNISWDDFMGLGRINPLNKGEKFSMSVLAAKLSQGMNGVSKIHGRVSREMFTELYPGYYVNELHISHVTNGVHIPSWVAKRWGKLYYEKLSNDFFNQQDRKDIWNKIYEVDDKAIWEIRNVQRKKMVDYLTNRLQKEFKSRQEAPKMLMNTLKGLRNNVLTIGFARRFATYKRAHLLFNNIERLEALMNIPSMPIQFVFAGKAHPADGAGQDLIKRIVEISKMPQFLGKIFFVENYDISLAKRLVSGVDIWLNNPTRPLEASGTSGEKAVMNGVLNLSVLDGWWAEGYVKGAGWALPEEETYGEQSMQDILDSSLLYQIIEEEILPAFYTRNESDVPEKWVQMIKKNIAEICPNFTMKRMLDDYTNQYYIPQIERMHKMEANNFALAKEIAAWKQTMKESWDEIEVVNVEFPDSTNRPLALGEPFTAKVRLRLHGLNPEDVGIEVLFGFKEDDKIKGIESTENFEIESVHENYTTYKCEIQASEAGVFNFAFRVFPKNANLPHRLDFPLVKWI